MVQRKYPKVAERFIVHDTKANEVNREEFFVVHDGGGTQISSAYDLCSKMITHDYEDWNIFPLHFTDGDNDPRDNQKVINTIKRMYDHSDLVRLFAFVHITSGNNRINTQLRYELEDAIGPFLDENSNRSRFATTEIPSQEYVLQGIRDIFGEKQDIT